MSFSIFGGVTPCYRKIAFCGLVSPQLLRILPCIKHMCNVSGFIFYFVDDFIVVRKQVIGVLV